MPGSAAGCGGAWPTGSVDRATSISHPTTAAATIALVLSSVAISNHCEYQGENQKPLIESMPTCRTDSDVERGTDQCTKDQRAEPAEIEQRFDHEVEAVSSTDFPVLRIISVDEPDTDRLWPAGIEYLRDQIANGVGVGRKLSNWHAGQDVVRHPAERAELDIRRRKRDQKVHPVEDGAPLLERKAAENLKAEKADRQDNENNHGADRDSPGRDDAQRCERKREEQAAVAEDKNVDDQKGDDERRCQHDMRRSKRSLVAAHACGPCHGRHHAPLHARELADHDKQADHQAQPCSGQKRADG